MESMSKHEFNGEEYHNNPTKYKQYECTPKAVAFWNYPIYNMHEKEAYNDWNQYLILCQFHFYYLLLILFLSMFVSKLTAYFIFRS